MPRELRLIVHRGRSVYDDIPLYSSSSSSCNKCLGLGDLQIADYDDATADTARRKSPPPSIQLRKRGFHAYVVALYVRCMQQLVYRASALQLLWRLVERRVAQQQPVLQVVVTMKLRTPWRQSIDYQWCERLTRLSWERLEIDHAMSWLSTLGGAFSALGDRHDRCAKVAGQISVEQFKLALRLGDPQLVARCNLYAALSLLQLGHLRVSARMVREIYKFALKERDKRLQNMCQGVWAKLQYYFHQKKSKQRQRAVIVVQ